MNEIETFINADKINTVSNYLLELRDSEYARYNNKFEILNQLSDTLAKLPFFLLKELEANQGYIMEDIKNREDISSEVKNSLPDEMLLEYKSEGFIKNSNDELKTMNGLILNNKGKIVSRGNENSELTKIHCEFEFIKRLHEKNYFVFELRLELTFPEVYNSEKELIIPLEKWSPRILFFKYAYNTTSYYLLNEHLEKSKMDLVTLKDIRIENATFQTNMLAKRVNRVKVSLKDGIEKNKPNVYSRSFLALIKKEE